MTLGIFAHNDLWLVVTYCGGETKKNCFVYQERHAISWLHTMKTNRTEHMNWTRVVCWMFGCGSSCRPTFILHFSFVHWYTHYKNYTFYYVCFLNIIWQFRLSILFLSMLILYSAILGRTWISRWFIGTAQYDNTFSICQYMSIVSLKM